MASTQEKAQCVVWLAETKSPKTVQRKFQTRYGKQPPDVKLIKSWMQKFLETGTVEKGRSAGRPSTSAETVENIRVAFHASPTKSLRQAERQLQVPKSTVHRVLRKRLKLHAYKVQIVQELKPQDYDTREQFAISMFEKLDVNADFLQWIVFSDEATFHISGYVNRHNARIWGSEKPQTAREHIRDSPKVNVWCALRHDTVIGPFFFHEKSVNANVYADMLENYAIPQLQDMQPHMFFQQDGAPPHWATFVRELLNRHFPNRWIGRNGPIPWPPRSPDITPLDFFLWGYVKDQVYATPVPNLLNLRERICLAIQSVTPQMLLNVWQELDYRLDILRVTRGAHIECLK